MFETSINVRFSSNFSNFIKMVDVNMTKNSSHSFENISANSLKIFWEWFAWVKKKKKLGINFSFDY